MAKTVGINQRISISVIEMAMKASLDGVFTPEYAADLAAGEYQGANRIEKASYMFGYDATCILGKLFHVQDNVSTQVIVNRLFSLYASNRTLQNGLYCIMPMYIEAGLLSRPTVGFYSKNDIEIKTDFARNLYAKSFFVNNPMLDKEYYDTDQHTYFEFVK